MESQVQQNFVSLSSNASVRVQTDAGPVLLTNDRQSAAQVMEQMRLLESREEGVRAVRGSMTGIGLEVIAAFCLYAIWQLGHLIR